MTIRSLALVCFAAAGCVGQTRENPGGQQSAAWRDPSPHRVQMVTVDTGVQLEVLDWGGSGQPVVLLAGLGSTAHVFDDFAPKLNAEYHVYGITRRGVGASSAPVSGYAADRLGDDVLAVLDSLKIDRAALVGHSLAGEELSSVGTRHPERVAALIYLDAAYSYAYYDRSRGDFAIDLAELQKKLDELRKRPRNLGQLVQELLQNNLPQFQKDLEELHKTLQAAPGQQPVPPAPTAADRASFPAYRSWYARIQGVTMPESELRQAFESTPDGGIGKQRTQPAVLQAIWAGEQKYSGIGVPVLAIYALPHDPGPFVNNDPAARAMAEAADKGSEAQAKAFESGVPSARVVRLPHASHAVFLSNEADVLREMRAFLGGLR